MFQVFPCHPPAQAGTHNPTEIRVYDAMGSRLRGDDNEEENITMRNKI
jgi:hypothetical protein